MSQSSNLYRLQQIDSQIDQVKNRLHEILAALEHNPILQQAQEQLERTDQTLTEARKALQKTEETVQDQHIKISQTESVLYGGKVRNPKELQDLQNDVTSLKRFLGVLEDRQLEAMLSLENAENEDKQAKTQYDMTLAQTTEERSGLRGEMTQLQKKVERLGIERQAATTVVNPTDLSLYEQLRQTRRGVAVTKVLSQACGACGALLTPALVQAATSPTQIIRCTSCGRILYAG